MLWKLNSWYWWNFLYFSVHLILLMHFFLYPIQKREKMISRDVTVRANPCEFITNLYCKSLDGCQFLHFESCHPNHTKSSVTFDKTPRMRKVMFLLMLNSSLMYVLLRESNYAEDLVNMRTKKALETPSWDRPEVSEGNIPGNHETWPPLVVKYNLFVSRPGQVIWKNLCFPYEDEEVKQVFIPAIFIFIRESWIKEIKKVAVKPAKVLQKQTLLRPRKNKVFH